MKVIVRDDEMDNHNAMGWIADLAESECKMRIDAILENLEKDIMLLMAQASILANAIFDAQAICIEAIKKFAAWEEVKQLREMLDTCLVYSRDKITNFDKLENMPLLDTKERQEAIRAGGVRIRPFPWMYPQFQQRQKYPIEQAKFAITIHSLGRASLEPSSIRGKFGDGTAVEEKDNLGIIAKANIKKGKRIFTDAASIAGMPDYLQRGRCDHCFARLERITVTDARRPDDFTFCTKECLHVAVKVGLSRLVGHS